AYLTGETHSVDFPTTPGAYQQTSPGGSHVFVTKLNASGTGLIYSTYLAGSGFESGFGVAVDSSGSAYVSGQTDASNFPTTPNAYQMSPGGDSDAFVTKLSTSGTGLIYSTYLGGNGLKSGAGVAGE